MTGSTAKWLHGEALSLNFQIPDHKVQSRKEAQILLFQTSLKLSCKEKKIKPPTEIISREANIILVIFAKRGFGASYLAAKCYLN